ncbi:MAG: TspO/MBR family protein [Phycisphaerae bacterium]|jgi:tryptophan-rich sensory protein
MNKSSQSVIKLVISFAATFAAAGIGSLGMTGENTWQWYEQLNKPFFQPPDWLFGPVWTVLYISMAIAVFLVWQRGFDKKNVRAAMLLFAVQLILNSFWTVIFFGMQSTLGGLIEIFILLAAIVLTIIQFKKVSTAAAILMLPYLAWVIFATLLNCSIYILNR